MSNAFIRQFYSLIRNLWSRVVILVSLIAVTSVALVPISQPNYAAITNQTQSLGGADYLVKGNQLLDEGRYEEALAAYDYR